MLDRGCRVIEKKQEASEVALTEIEQMLLMFYRSLSERDQAYLLRITKVLASESTD